MIATSIEQSKELVRLGLDPNTADMVWMFNKWLYSIKDNILNQEQFSEQDTLAWSLSALLKVMPKDTNETYHLFSSMNELGSWVCDRSKYYMDAVGHNKNDYECFKGDNPISAAYEMVCWLLENNLIKKGGNDEGES